MTHELAPLGIKSVAIEPGPFRTNFLDGSSLSVAQTQFDDYSATGGAARTWATDTNYGQDGDPIKAAKIIVDLASYDELPERIQLGANAVNDVAAKLQRTASDQQQWWSISLSTDYVAP
jgi:NAD(P)-dependent dehydrogenase (short-subunit alcohol dehydrogenase family)